MLGTALDAAAVSATQARTSAGLSGSQVPVGQQFFTAHSDPVTSASAHPGLLGGGSAAAWAQLGVLQVQASAYSEPGGRIGSASAESSFAEDITLNAPGLTGTLAEVVLGVTLQGQVTPQGAMGGSVDFSFMGGGFLGGWSALSSPAFPGGFPVDGVTAVAGGPLSYSRIENRKLTVTLGTPFTVTERLKLSTFKIDCPFNTVLCEASGAGAVSLDWSHTSYWNGISAVSLIDASGHKLPADLGLFSATSTTGLDMMRSFAPVPEPASAALLLLGLAALRSRVPGCRAAQQAR